ncbi:MAG: hypothetical protein JO127_14750 [Caulobacteraceae bacterium]|nr:hypothetical protein [Caulobacteraceae bacterium]
MNEREQSIESNPDLQRREARQAEQAAEERRAMAAPAPANLQDGEGLTTADLASADQPAAGRPEEARSFAPKAPALSSDAEQMTPLFAGGEAQELKVKWDQIQAGFVDAPRAAVEQADGLVAQTMKRLAEMFAEERSKLEGQWDRGDDVSTEDLRVALRRYRSFFTRLVSI